jgi:hypothetical protein
MVVGPGELQNYMVNIFLIDLTSSLLHLLEEPLDWRRIQTLVRSMPGLHKTLIIACVKRIEDSGGAPLDKAEMQVANVDYSRYQVEELAIASEHAPFKHKTAKGVGMQFKPSAEG